MLLEAESPLLGIYPFRGLYTLPLAVNLSISLQIRLLTTLNADIVGNNV